MKNIFIDLDNTIFKFDIRQYIKYYYNLQDFEITNNLNSIITIENINNYENIVSKGELSKHLFKLFDSSFIYENQELLNNYTREVLEYLKKEGFYIRFITARNKSNEIVNATLNNLNKYNLLDLAESIEFNLVTFKDRVDYMDQFKGKSFLIDDNYENVLEASSRGHYCLLINNNFITYNKNIENVKNIQKTFSIASPIDDNFTSFNYEFSNAFRIINFVNGDSDFSGQRIQKSKSLLLG